MPVLTPPDFEGGHLGNCYGCLVGHGYFFVKLCLKIISEDIKQYCDPITDIYHMVNGNIRGWHFDSKGPLQVATLDIFMAPCKSWHFTFSKIMQNL